MNGDVSRLDNHINDLTSKTEDKLAYLDRLLGELEDRLNQEESDRASADTSLEDRIADLENA